MSIKKLFDNIELVGTSTTASYPQIQDINNEVESSNYAIQVSKAKNRVIPQVDYTQPINFARYGSAEEYYAKGIEWIYNYYPYDGSLKEKEEWQNSASYLEEYIFENDYPRTNGYVIFSANGWGTQASSNSGYGVPSSLEFIQVKSGPNEKNIWKPSKNREENLKFDFTDNGATIEFWLKKDEFLDSLTTKEVIFDLWNGKHFNDNNEYGRLRIELSGTSPGAVFRITALSGTNGFYDAPIGEDITPSTMASSDWSHYAFTMINSGSNVEVEMYKDGAYTAGMLTGSTIGHVTGTMIANIGALRTPPRFTSALTGSGKLSGSLDEFRYWKTKRSARDIGRYYISQVGGGANTDDATVDLGLYYKFNEGIVGNSTVDSTVLDYSGRTSNGTWTGYSSNSRNTASAMVLSKATTFEFKDPIIYAAHPQITSLLTSKKEIGEIHDISNVNSLYKSFPSWITEDDEEVGGTLKNLTQIMGSYLDELYNHIENLPAIKNISFPSSSAQTGSFKPYPFSKRLLTSQGLNVPELFIDTTVLEQFSSRDEKIKYEEKIYNTKNLIYQNIYNNLIYIFKTKGTTKSINNMIRAFGANEDIININVYANNADSELRKNIKQETIRKKVFNFNDIDRNSSTIYQHQTGSGTISYISGSGADGLMVPTTVECEVIFPKKVDSFNPLSYYYNNVSASLFGQHTINPASPTSLTWNTDDAAAFQVYAVRDKLGSSDAYFKLTGSLITELTTSVYKNVYDNEKWNFAVRLRPSSSFGDLVYGGARGYKIEFYGVSQDFGAITNEFFLTGTLSHDDGARFLTHGKRLYAGAHRTNFNSTTLVPTDVKLSNLRFWMNYIDNTTMRDHAISMYSYGPGSPMRNASATQTSLKQLDVPIFETLALNWDFRTVSSSANAAGQITIEDFSSGSTEAATRYGWLGDITQQMYSGIGDLFLANETDVAPTDYIFTTRNKLPEQFNSADMISIGENSDEVFTRDTRPVDYFFAIENSLYRVISEEMLNIFSSVLDFNNLIGEPVNKYRPAYKDMGKLRQLFFERVENKPDVEKYFTYFVHVDAFIQEMLEQLIPASSNVSDSALNIIESHILERNKYTHKFPTVESKRPDPETVAFGIGELLFDWKFGHAPIPANQATKLHLLARAGRARRFSNNLWRYNCRRATRNNKNYCEH